MFFQLVTGGGFPDLINQKSYNSSWKKILRFRNKPAGKVKKGLKKLTQTKWQKDSVIYHNPKCETLLSSLERNEWMSAQSFFPFLIYQKSRQSNTNKSRQVKTCHSVFHLLTCSWHQKNETTNSPIHQFKVLQNVFKMKKQGSKCFSKQKWEKIHQ